MTKVTDRDMMQSATFVLMESQPKRFRGVAFVFGQKDFIEGKIWPTMILSKRQIFMASHCFQTKWSPHLVCQKLFTVYASAFSRVLCVEVLASVEEISLLFQPYILKHISLKNVFLRLPLEEYLSCISFLIIFCPSVFFAKVIFDASVSVDLGHFCSIRSK